MMPQPEISKIKIDSCPVCGTTVVNPESAKIKATVFYYGHRYYLMSDRCKKNFLRKPDRYIDEVGNPKVKPQLPGMDTLNSQTDRESYQ